MNAVIGNPLEHSLSPVLHNEMYKILSVGCEFVKDEDESIENLIERIKNKPYELVAVTMPHKQSIIDFLDDIDTEAKEIGSVNTVINKEGKLKGYNTDIFGIEYALRDIDLENKNVLVIGAGGVARTVMFVIRKMKGNIVCTNRTKEKAESLIEEFGGKFGTLEEMKFEDIDVIINTTSIGMYPHIDQSPLSKEFLQPKHTVFDIVYNPVETKLLQDAKEVGVKVISGLEMFIAQGIKQIELWQDAPIDVDKYYSDLRNVLIENIK